MGKRAAVYCRISRDRTGAAAGTQRQERDCRALVDERGWQLVEVYIDDDTSAYSGRRRPEYERLLEAVEAGDVDVIVAWHPDRLTRSPRELEDLIDALESGRCTVETVRAGRWDLSTRSGRTTARLIGAVARDESEAKAERLRAMHADRARRGLWSGGPRPYAYEPNTDGRLNIVEAEADIVREVASRVLAGEWVGAVASDLNARGVPTVRGGRWAAQTLIRMLTSPTVAGRRQHDGRDVEAWPAILDPPTWRQLRGRLFDAGRARGTVARVSLLAGVARCSTCDTKLITQRRQTGVRVYVCPSRNRGGCGGVQIVADPVDDLVASRLLDELDRPEFLAELTPSDDGRRDELAAQLEALDARRADRARMWAAGEISEADWRAAGAALDTEGTRLEAEIAELPAPAVALDPALLREGWKVMTLAEKRALVAMFVDAVIVSPARRRGPGFDRGRVEIAWRHA